MNKGKVSLDQDKIHLLQTSHISISDGRTLYLNKINNLFPWANEVYKVYMPDQTDIAQFSFVEIKLLGEEGQALIMVRKNQVIYHARSRTTENGYLKAYKERPWIRLVLINNPKETNGSQYWHSYGSSGTFICF